MKCVDSAVRGAVIPKPSLLYLRFTLDRDSVQPVARRSGKSRSRTFETEARVRPTEIGRVCPYAARRRRIDFPSDAATRAMDPIGQPWAAWTGGVHFGAVAPIFLYVRLFRFQLVLE